MIPITIKFDSDGQQAYRDLHLRAIQQIPNTIVGHSAKFTTTFYDQSAIDVYFSFPSLELNALGYKFSVPKSAGPAGRKLLINVCTYVVFTGNFIPVKPIDPEGFGGIYLDEVNRIQKLYDKIRADVLPNIKELASMPIGHVPKQKSRLWKLARAIIAQMIVDDPSVILINSDRSDASDAGPAHIKTVDGWTIDIRKVPELSKRIINELDSYIGYDKMITDNGLSVFMGIADTIQTKYDITLLIGNSLAVCTSLCDDDKYKIVSASNLRALCRERDTFIHALDDISKVCANAVLLNYFKYLYDIVSPTLDKKIAIMDFISTSMGLEVMSYLICYSIIYGCRRKGDDPLPQLNKLFNNIHIIGYAGEPIEHESECGWMREHLASLLDDIYEKSNVKDSIARPDIKKLNIDIQIRPDIPLYIRFNLDMGRCAAYTEIQNVPHSFEYSDFECNLLRRYVQYRAANREISGAGHAAGPSHVRLDAPNMPLALLIIIVAVATVIILIYIMIPYAAISRNYIRANSLCIP